jgi:putative chitinase
MFILTGEILLKIVPKLEIERAKKLSQLINEICPMYGIDSANILHEFLANVIHESNHFEDKVEKLNYSAKRLIQVWPTRFQSWEKAVKFSANEKLLAEEVYGNRRDLGNIQPGDGWRFRGSGFIQMTGRLNFVAFSSFIRQKFKIIKPLDQIADDIRTNDDMALHSACYIFAISKDLISAAIANNMIHIVKRINGGLTGLDSRLEFYTLCKNNIVDFS